MKVSACCMCMSVSTGVKILACLDFIMWLQATNRGDILHFFLTMFSCSAFALLLHNDCAKHRMLFFITYTVYRIILLVTYTFNIYT